MQAKLFSEKSVWTVSMCALYLIDFPHPYLANQSSLYTINLLKNRPTVQKVWPCLKWPMGKGYEIKGAAKKWL